MNVIAVTGAGGMIGAHLVEVLRSRGVRIRGLFLPGEAIPASYGDVDVVRGDIRNRGDIVRLLEGADTVFHLAALVGRDANGVSLAKAREINVDGTRNVVAEAKIARVRRLVFLSSCCVYGLHSQADEIVSETTAYAPQSLPYDLTKTEAELAVTAESAEALAWSVLQIPVALGGELTRDKPTITALISLARTGLAPRPLLGANYVNYVYGRDVAEALVLLAEHPAAVGQTFIHSESASLPEFLAWIAGEFEGRVRSVPVPGPVMSLAARFYRSAALLTNRRRFSGEKIRRQLGFTPAVGLRNGVAATVRHYTSSGPVQ